MRVLLLKKDGSLLAMDSISREGKLTSNYLRSGYLKEEIEEKVVSNEEYNILVEKWWNKPEREKQEKEKQEKENLRKQKENIIKQKLNLSDEDFLLLKGALDFICPLCH